MLASPGCKGKTAGQTGSSTLAQDELTTERGRHHRLKPLTTGAKHVPHGLFSGDTDGMRGRDSMYCQKPDSPVFVILNRLGGREQVNI
jgi:hypothetical protein